MKYIFKEKNIIKNYNNHKVCFRINNKKKLYKHEITCKQVFLHNETLIFYIGCMTWGYFKKM